MHYDAAYRHKQAVDPSALNTLTAALHALNSAIDDCRSSGVAHDADPAVLLLARRLGYVATIGKPSDNELRRTCMTSSAKIRTHPALLTIMARDLGYNPDAKAEFHREGHKVLKRLAAFLELTPGSFEVRSCKGGPAVSGEVILHSTEIYVMLGQGCLGQGNEVLYRRVSSYQDYTGERNHFATVRELVEPERFAAKLRAELALTTPNKRARLAA